MPESTRHREAFDIYFSLGPDRSIPTLRAALIERGGRVPTERSLYEWSRRYGWQERLAEIERRARAAADDARVDAIREMNARHAKEGLLLQQKGAQWIQQITEDGATPEGATRAIVEGAKLERLARGEATDRPQHLDAPDPRLENFTDEELRRLAAAAKAHLQRTLAAESD